MEYLFQIIITFSGILGAFYVSKLANEKNKSFTDILGYLMTLSILIWGSNYLVDTYIFDKSKDVFEEKYAFENAVDGVWFQEWNVDTVHNYSIIEISFNPSTLKLNIKGTGYAANGEMFVNWTSKGAYFDVVGNKILYSYDGEFKDQRLKGEGYSEINFSNNQVGKKYLTASGYFSDSFTKFKPASFEIDRITKDEFQKFIGKDNFHYSLDKVNFVKKYHRMKHDKR